MAKVIPLNKALKLFFVLILAIVVMNGGSLLSDRLTASPTATFRWLGVVLAVVSLVPWLWVIAWPIMHLDEYYRRVALAGTALAFIVTLLVQTGFNAVVDAHLVSSTFYLPTLPVAMGIWLISVGAASLYYRASL